MKKVYVSLLLIFIVSGKLFSQSPVPEWITDLDYSKSGFTGVYRTLVDANGNIFSMVLSGPINYGPFDHITIKKFDSAGNLLWSKIFSGKTNFGNQGDLTLDANGNPIVMYESNSNNIAIVKFDTDGGQQWSYTYPSACGSFAYDIETDASGNVFCCGGTYDCGGNSKLLSLKLNGSGQLLWSVFYDPENYFQGRDGSYSLDIDQAGNVFVGGTGYHNATGIGNNVIILKYNSSGAFKWVYEYNGESSSTSDQIRDIVADNTGGCYAVGEINTITGKQDIGAFKISATGALLWLYHKNGSGNNFDNGNAIKLTSSGEPVISCGISTSSSGYAWLLVKLNSSTGAETWSKQYDGPDSNNDYGGTGLQIDANGNFFQFGGTYSFAAASNMVYLKYDNNGTAIDTVAYSSSGIYADVFIDGTIDGSGNVYLGGYTDISIVNPFANARLIKYDDSGVQQWVNIFSAPGYAEETVTSSVADEKGNLYIAGTYDDSTIVRHLRVIALNNDGSVKWKTDFKGNGFLDINPLITLDHDGNIIIATAELVGSYNILLIKFDTAGHVLWNKDFNLTVDYDYPTDVTVDQDNNICVACTGYFSSSSGNNIFTLKCNGSDGAQQWLNEYNGGKEDVSIGIAVDSSGNVFVNGNSTLATKNRMITIKYSPAGVSQWTSFVTNDVTDFAEAMVLTKDNNVVTGGYSIKTSGDRNLRIVKYDNVTGQQLFNTTYDHLNQQQYDFLTQMTSDDSSNIYCTGNSTVVADSVLTFKLSADGILQWTRSFSFAPNIQFNSLGYDIRFDGKQNIFVVAQSSNRIALLNYKTNGELQWVYTTPDTLYPLIIHHRYIALNQKGAVYMAYTSFDSITYKDYRAIKFCDFAASAIIADGPTTFCKGAFVILNAGIDSMSTYQWLKNGADIASATEVNYKVKKKGDYQVLISNGVCGALSDTLAVVVNVLPPAIVTPSGEVNICLGDTILLSADNVNGATYQWLRKNQIINGATANAYGAFKAGKYKVVVTKNNTGCSDTSAATKVIITCKTGLQQSLAPVLYPNPNDGRFTLDLSNIPEDAAIIITDLVGKVVWEKLSSNTSDQVLSVNLSQLSSGLYYVIIKVGNNQWVEKMEIVE